MTTALQHYLNPLHVYCRLRDIGLRKGLALLLCQLYERAIYPPTQKATGLPVDECEAG